MSIIHISVGGPVYKLTAAKQFKFEDHPYFRPHRLGSRLPTSRPATIAIVIVLDPR